MRKKKNSKVKYSKIYKFISFNKRYVELFLIRLDEMWLFLQFYLRFFFFFKMKYLEKIYSFNLTRNRNIFLCVYVVVNIKK